MNIKKTLMSLTVFSIMSASSNCFAVDMFDQIVGVNSGSVEQGKPELKNEKRSADEVGQADKLSGQNVNPFTGESLTVEESKNKLSVVTLKSQILDKELEIAKKQGELDILPIRINNQKQIESTSSPVVGQQMLQEQLVQQQQRSQEEINRRVQEEVRKVSMAKDYEIQTIKKQVSEKKKRDSEMKLSYIGNSAGDKSAVIRIGDNDLRVKEGGVVAGWNVASILPESGSVLLTKNGRQVSLGLKRSVSRVSNSSKTSDGTSDYGYQGAQEVPVMPNLPQQLPLPVLK